jgi:hydrogenase maturation factor HypF (carbamoyltransferase family)
LKLPFDKTENVYFSQEPSSAPKIAIVNHDLLISQIYPTQFISNRDASNFEIQMSSKNEKEKICPECEEDMKAAYDKNKVLVCWECTECGFRISVAKKS